MAYFKGVLVQNRSKFAKIAPEGVDFFLGLIFFWIFGKVKKTLAAASFRSSRKLVKYNFMEVTDAIHDFNPFFRTAEKIQPKTIISAEHIFLSA